MLVSDKYGDEGLVMLIKCIFLKEEFQITQEEGFLIKNGNFGESSCHDGRISLSFNAVDGLGCLVGLVNDQFRKAKRLIPCPMKAEINRNIRMTRGLFFQHL